MKQLYSNQNRKKKKKAKNSSLRIPVYSLSAETSLTFIFHFKVIQLYQNIKDSGIWNLTQTSFTQNTASSEVKKTASVKNLYQRVTKRFHHLAQTTSQNWSFLWKFSSESLK